MTTGTCTKIVLPFNYRFLTNQRMGQLSPVLPKVAVSENPVQSASEALQVQLAEETLNNVELVSRKTLLKDEELLEKRLRTEEEAVWIEQAAEGNMDSFKMLFDRYYMRLRSVAYGILSNEEDAADVCQEAFFKAYKNLSGFRGQSSFYTWMYRIVYNLCIDLSRKSSRKREIATDEISVFEQGAKRPYSEYFMPLPTSPEDEAYRGQLAKSISKAMDELSPAHRAVISLREIDGLSYEEISQSLECSVGTVMSRLFHARKKLSSALEKVLGDKANALK